MAAVLTTTPDTVTTIIQAIIYLIPLITLLITIFTMSKNETKEDTSTLTSMLIRLENINTIVSETQKDMKVLSEDVRAIDKRVTRLETLMEEKND